LMRFRPLFTYGVRNQDFALFTGDAISFAGTEYVCGRQSGVLPLHSKTGKNCVAMAIYAISDLHLSSVNPKPMDIFGPAWEDHAAKARENWDETVTDDDIVLLPGDLSWAMTLSEARPDLDFVAERPGRKVLIRGNHDYWWQRRATSKIQRIVDRDLVFLQGTSVLLGDVGITGTRGWRVDWEMRSEGASSHVEPGALPEEDRSGRVLRRELDYFERGLKSIPEAAGIKIAMLHFPPFDERLQPNEFAELLTRYSVDILVYGHVHLGLGGWLEGLVGGVRYHMVSADVVGFVPQLILP